MRTAPTGDSQDGGVTYRVIGIVRAPAGLRFQRVGRGGIERSHPISLRHPFDHNSDDETWLVAVASRHNGKLAEFIVESAPMQRTAWFESICDARAFADELANSGRWRARMTA